MLLHRHEKCLATLHVSVRTATMETQMESK